MSDEVQATSHDDELAVKRERAAKAMSSGFNHMADPSIDLLIKPIPQTAKDSMSLAEQRLKAQIAMEGEDRRKKREEAARKEREVAELARIEEERKKKEAFEKARMDQQKIEQDIRTQEQRERTSQILKQQVEEVKAGGGGLKTIRTLKFDQDNLIKGQNLSTIGIAIKEEERRRQRQENSSLSSGKNKTLLVVSLVLLLLGFGIAFYIYNQYYATIPQGILPGKGVAAESIIFADMTRSIDTTDLTLDDLLNRIKNEVRNPPDLRLGAIEDFIFNKKDAQGILVPLNAEEFFKTIVSGAPDSFLRTLNKEFMFGVLSSAENAAFIIIKTESYDKGLAGLLTWEGTTLTKDLYPVLTSLKPDATLLTKPFEDLLIKNFDTRVLKDADGNIRLVYGFLDGEKTIVIAGSKQAFIEVLSRYSTPRPLSI